VETMKQIPAGRERESRDETEAFRKQPASILRRRENRVNPGRLLLHLTAMPVF
jgi:hypothetical protein